MITSAEGKKATKCKQLTRERVYLHQHCRMERLFSSLFLLLLLSFMSNVPSPPSIANPPDKNYGTYLSST